MAFRTTGMDLTRLNDIEELNISQLNISDGGEDFVRSLPERARETTEINGTSYFGLGIMITLFMYLVFTLGDVLNIRGQSYSSLRTVGLAAGITSAIGGHLLAIGFFSSFYHVVIFLTIQMVCTMWLWYEDRR